MGKKVTKRNLTKQEYTKLMSLIGQTRAFAYILSEKNLAAEPKRAMNSIWKNIEKTVNNIRWDYIADYR